MGFLTGPYALLIKAGGILLILAAVAGWSAYKMRQHDNVRYDALQVEYTTFKADVAAAGKQAQERATAQVLADKQRKENVDKEHEKAVAAMDATIRGLRIATDRRSQRLPAASAATSRPDLACFDRAEFERTMGEADKRLLDGARSLADEGTKATLDLDFAKSWAK